MSKPKTERYTEIPESVKILTRLEGAYAKFISTNLTKTELSEVLKGNDEPIIALACDMVSSDEDLLIWHYSKKPMAAFFGSVATQVGARVVERQEILAKEETERQKSNVLGGLAGNACYMKAIETASKNFCITQLIQFASSMNVKLDQTEAEELSVRICKELGTKLYGMVFDIVQDYCKEQGIIPEKSPEKSNKRLEEF